MGSDKKCPKCELWNSPNATRCDCGYDFQSGSQERSYLSPGQHRDIVGEREGRKCAAKAFFTTLTLLILAYYVAHFAGRMSYDIVRILKFAALPVLAAATFAGAMYGKSKSP